MATINTTEEFENLSYAEKMAEIRQLEANAKEKRGAEIADLIAAFKADCIKLDLPILDAVALLTPKSGPVKDTEKKSSKKIATQKPIPSLTYKNPNGDEAYVGGTKGPRPKWLRDLLDAGTKFADLVAK